MGMPREALDGDRFVQGIKHTSIAEPKYEDTMHKMMNTVRTPVSIERGGVTHRGYFEVDGPTIRVSHKGSTKVTQLGGHARVPATLARLLLSEFVREAGEHHA